jgi:hypothetical protein
MTKIWKNVLRPLGVVAIFGAIAGALGHFQKYGPKLPPAERGSEKETA